jgi:para-aminobenzoate synthetase component 1
MKGTRRRDDDSTRDRRQCQALKTSEKDRAENLMIVDLLRNDLSKICLPGSVRVPGLFRLQSWATVHHLVSIVTGQLRLGVTTGDIIRATFPSGSVTGAPKIRAMEIIADLERVARGPYCGAIGYISFNGQMDLSVAIRILMTSEGRATFHAGGGVVYDSDPEDEYRETLVKARALTEVVKRCTEWERTDE